MLAFRLPAGTHSIRLDYCPSGFKTGCIITMTSLLLFAGACLWNLRKQKRIGKAGIFNNLHFSENNSLHPDVMGKDGD